MTHRNYLIASILAIASGYSSTTTAATVASDILVSPVAISGLVEGAGFTDETVATFSDTNSPGSVADYTATINWGDFTTSPGTIIGNGGGSFTVTGSHTYAEEGPYLYSADVTYSPLGFVAIGISDTASVADAALSLISVPSAISFSPGLPLTNLLLATFSDANAFGLVSDFTGTIDWGDGTPSQAATIVAVSPGEFSLEGSHTYAAGGSFPVSINIDDDGGSSLQTSTNANSNSAPEPTTLSVLGLGLAGLGYSRRERKRR